MNRIRASYRPGRLWAVTGVGVACLLFSSDYLFLPGGWVEETEAGDFFLGVPLFVVGIALTVFGFKELIFPRVVLGGDPNGLLLGVSWPWLPAQRIPWRSVIEVAAVDADFDGEPVRAVSISFVPGFLPRHRPLGLPLGPAGTLLVDQGMLEASVDLLAARLAELREDALGPPAGVTIERWSPTADPLDELFSVTSIVDRGHRPFGPGDLASCRPEDVLVAREPSGAVIGVAAVLPSSTKVVGVVTPAWRRCGVGSALQRAAEQRVAARAALAPDAPPTVDVLVSAHARNEQLGSESERIVFFAGLGYRSGRSFLRLRHEPGDGPATPVPEGVRVQALRPQVDAQPLLAAFPDAFGGNAAVPEGHHVLVAWEGDGWDARVVGYTRTSRGRSVQEGRAESWVEDLAVDPAWRGRGLGQPLLAAAVAAEEDVAAVLVTVDADASGGAALYEAMGFVLEAEIVELVKRMSVRPPQTDVDPAVLAPADSSGAG